MKIEMKNPVGVHLLTKNRFCRENVDVVPRLDVLDTKQNGKFKPGEGYAGFGEVNVQVEGGEASLTTKEIAANGTYSAADDGADGYSSVTVAVPEVIPEGYIKPEGTITIKENKTGVDVSQYSLADIAVPEPEITIEDVEITPSEETQEVTASNADYIGKVTVNPIPSEYVKPEGTYPITENGDYNIKAYESVSVNVPTGAGDSTAQPLTVTGNSITYDTAYKYTEYDVTAVEEWDTDINGVSYKKVSAIMPESITAAEILKLGIHASMSISGQAVSGYITEIALDASLTGAMIIDFGRLIYVKSAEAINTQNSTTYFEDGCVYISDYQTSGVDYYAWHLPTEIDENGAFFPVTVQVPEPEITTEDVEITPTEETQEVSAESADYIGKVTVKPIPSEYVKPDGTVTITKNQTGLDVSKYKLADIDVPTEGGGTGGDIIEVDTLPTENIDENALYLCDGVYYKPVTAFADVLINRGDDVDVMEFISYINAYGGTASVNTIPTLTDEPGKPTDGENLTIHVYYVEDLADSGEPCYIYTENGWEPFSGSNGIGSPYMGTITDKSEATEEGYYALFAPTWKAYRSGAGIIEVTELPTENIDEESLYSCGESYYKYIGAFNDIAIGLDATAIYPISLLSVAYGYTVSFNVIPEFTADGVKASGNGAFHFYYAESEKEKGAFCYIDGNWVDGVYAFLGYNDFPFGGFITSITDAVPGKYYILGGWEEYKKIGGSVSISENGTFDVAGKKTATVAVPSVMIVNSADELPTEGVIYGTLAYVLGIEEETT